MSSVRRTTPSCPALSGDRRPAPPARAAGSAVRGGGRDHGGPHRPGRPSGHARRLPRPPPGPLPGDRADRAHPGRPLAFAGLTDGLCTARLRLSAGGQVRLRYANAFGTAPVLVGPVTADGHPVTFTGQRQGWLAAGSSLTSDPVEGLQVEDGSLLTVETRLPGPTGPLSFHRNTHAWHTVDGVRTRSVLLLTGVGTTGRAARSSPCWATPSPRAPAPRRRGPPLARPAGPQAARIRRRQPRHQRQPSAPGQRPLRAGRSGPLRPGRAVAAGAADGPGPPGRQRPPP